MNNHGFESLLWVLRVFKDLFTRGRYYYAKLDLYPQELRETIDVITLNPYQPWCL